jgi:predicted SAM-dependent methyltransferase
VAINTAVPDILHLHHKNKNLEPPGRQSFPSERLTARISLLEKSDMKAWSELRLLGVGDSQFKQGDDFLFIL